MTDEPHQIFTLNFDLSILNYFTNSQTIMKLPPPFKQKERLEKRVNTTSYSG